MLRYERYAIDPRVTAVLGPLEDTDFGPPLLQRLQQVALEAPTALSDAQLHEALRAHLWVLERAEGDGLPLTSAGYLRPADVRELAKVLPTMRRWNFGIHREIDTQPVLQFRRQLRELGLLRKYRDSVRLTRFGRAALIEPRQLWEHLGDVLLPEDDFAAMATVLLLIVMSTPSEGPVRPQYLAAALAKHGWRRQDGDPLSYREIDPLWRRAEDLLEPIGVLAADAHRTNLSEAARALVREVFFIPLPGRGVGLTAQQSAERAWWGGRPAPQ